MPRQFASAPLLATVMAAMLPACTPCATGELGYAVNSHYDNPVVLQRADPWMVKDSDTGCYYFIATVPEFDRIEMRQACRIDELKLATPVVVWNKKTSGALSANIWAPELHRINGSWYIYFAASDVDAPFKIRMYALSNTSADPLQGTWQEEGEIKSGWDGFALDATSFEFQGKRYLLWAQQNPERTYNSALWLAEMASPTRIKSPIIKLSEPTLEWETLGYKVNEGPAVLQKDGRLFVFYSASATDDRYAMGLLSLNIEDDILIAENWQKQPQPIFTTNADVNRYGPGHNSFVMNEDNSQLLMVYHSRDYRQLKGNPLTDPNRHTRVRAVQWAEDGWPQLHPELGD